MAGGVTAALTFQDTNSTKVRDLLDVNNCPDVIFPTVEGEASMTAHCNLLGNFELSLLPPAPCGVLLIGVMFDSDANGSCVSAGITTISKNMVTRSQNMGRLNQASY